MFWRILKKDLKRKKTMNIILLLFVILCSMFAAAAVNNIIAVTGGIERYLCVFSSRYFRHNGKKLDNFTNAAYLLSDSEMAISYFDENNNIIESVGKGCFYANAPFLQDLTIKEGDEVELDVGDSHLTLKFMVRFKGVLFSSRNTDSPYLIMNSADYDYLGRDECKGIYLYDMIPAYVLMMISIVLMFTAFVVLRFTIVFTVSEKFREIGVMKAVGIDNVRRIEISFDKMDGCELITLSSTGCTLEVKELPQIFESLHRGNNADRV